MFKEDLKGSLSVDKEKKFLQEESCAQETVANEPVPMVDSVSNIFENGMFLGKQQQYQIQGRIGKGGMGTVFLALNKQTQTQVAIKFIRFSTKASTELMGVFRQRFEREIEILSRLEHPNIIKILDSGLHSYKSIFIPYYVMEYVRGETLDQLQVQNSLSISAILEMIIALSDALTYTHQKKIVHRDIKPSNIFITEAGVPKLLDFGLAKLYEETEESSRLTFSQMILGTFEFMAPEQGAHPKDVYPQSDIYSLGHILYWILTGKLAVDTHFLRQYLEERNFSRLLNELPSQLTQQNLKFDAFIDPELRNICQKALHIHLRERYATAKDFGDALRSYKEHLTQKEKWEHHFLFPVSQSRSNVPISINIASWLEAQLDYVSIKNDTSLNEEANWGEFVPFGNSCLLEAKKTIQINQHFLNAGESIYLQDGDLIQVYSSTFIYKKAPENQYFTHHHPLQEDEDSSKKI